MTRIGCPRALALSAIAAFSLLGSDATADEAQAKKTSGWQRLFREHAAAYRIALDGDSQADVALAAEPILQWTQPVRGGADGAVFLWTHAGRPAAIGTFFVWPMGDGRQGVAHELHSLSAIPLTAVWKDRTWTPPKDAIEWAPISSEPEPGETAEQRMRQMRELARRFKAESRDKNDRRWELRLLPRPIYRYALDGEPLKTAPGDVFDGAIFGFVEGADLEVVLLVQARRTASQGQWEYALARMSDFHLQAAKDGKTVWEVDNVGYDNPRVAYYCSTVESRTSAEEQ